ncbi:MAG: EamA family transporter [Candidatus Moranbacteria bacterium]|nr:EamA family transporter [Candidatus Moranbacteria bacterium]
MSWFFIALIGPVLYAASNHIDKYLIEKYFKGGESGALILFSSLFSVVTLPVIYLIDPGVFSLDLTTIAVLVLNGMLTVVCIILYFKALQDDEASIVIPYYQTIPIFGFILGYFFLGETLTLAQIISCGLIIAGTIILSLNFIDGKLKFKKKVAALMLLASFLYAVGGVVFKIIAVEDGFWASIFWDFFGSVLLGVILYFSISSYRKQFLQVIRMNSWGVMSLNAFNEIIFVVADGVFAYATLLAPIALVMTVNGFQPAFVFLLGVTLTLFFPKLGRESVTATGLAHKILAIGLIVEGAVFLSINF